MLYKYIKGVIMLVWEVIFSNECPNKLIKESKRDICNKCKYK